MISVCMATYNGEQYLHEQVDSILMQLSDTDELIISDDGSKDRTIAILEAYDDRRIKIFRNEKHHGVVGNFENALKNASGNLLFLSDQDDIWLPNKIETMINALQAFDLAVCNAQIIDGNGKLTGNGTFFDIRNSGKGFWKNLYKNTYLGCCMAFRREVLNYTMPFPRKIAMHDVWIGLNANLRDKVIFLPQPLTLYRRHGNNASPTGEKSNFSLTKKIKYRIQFLGKILINLTQ